jgi:hypothetical protein
MVYFSIKNKDINYLIKVSEYLRNFYDKKNIKFTMSEIESSPDGDWYITVSREGNINAYNL